jgi:hypothetical protein
MEAHTHDVTITVNERPVVVKGPRISGRDIKQAAIAQGVPIQADFVLSEELGQGHTRIIGDGDIIAVHPGSRFLAIAPDDNS